ncbi:MAG: CBS domain-containing protein [Deltaproteobacteria bacterium]|nr:CBS domain-containing protein [Deltaproteobacteria bacterium]
MKVRELMSTDPVCCTPSTSLKEVAGMMLRNDCGAIPVVDNEESMRLVGIITDRDITCRSVAQGKNPQQQTAGECMTTALATVTPDTSLQECCAVMENNMVRRIPVIDKEGRCCGVIAQADLALQGPEKLAAEVVREVSQPNGETSVATF